MIQQKTVETESFEDKVNRRSLQDSEDTVKSTGFNAQRV